MRRQMEEEQATPEALEEELVCPHGEDEAEMLLQDVLPVPSQARRQRLAVAVFSAGLFTVAVFVGVAIGRGGATASRAAADSALSEERYEALFLTASNAGKESSVMEMSTSNGIGCPGFFVDRRSGGVCLECAEGDLVARVVRAQRARFEQYRKTASTDPSKAIKVPLVKKSLDAKLAEVVNNPTSLKAAKILSEFNSVVPVPSCSAPLDLATDGFTFKFSFLLKLGKYSRNRPIITSSTGAFNLLALNPQTDPKWRQLQFSIQTLTKGTAGAVVTSGKGLMWPDVQYRVTVEKTRAKLCIQMAPVPGIDIKLQQWFLANPTATAPFCEATTVEDLMLFQMRPPGRLSWGAQGKSLEALDYKQLAGRVPLYFDILHVDLAKPGLQVSKLRTTIQKAVAVHAGSGISLKDVSVTTDGVAVEDEPAVRVQVFVTVPSTVDPTITKARLEASKSLWDTIEARVTTEIPKASVALADLSASASWLTAASLPPLATERLAPVPCSNFTCPAFYNSNSKTCTTSNCTDVCCEPVPCSQFNCSAISPQPFKTNRYALTNTCNSLTACKDTCCYQDCVDYNCTKPGVCHKPWALETRCNASFCESQCCAVPTCCQGPQAACRACKVCNSTAEYCIETAARLFLGDGNVSRLVLQWSRREWQRRSALRAAQRSGRRRRGTRRLEMKSKWYINNPSLPEDYNPLGYGDLAATFNSLATELGEGEGEAEGEGEEASAADSLSPPVERAEKTEETEETEESQTGKTAEEALFKRASKVSKVHEGKDGKDGQDSDDGDDEGGLNVTEYAAAFYAVATTDLTKPINLVDDIWRNITELQKRYACRQEVWRNATQLLLGCEPPVALPGAYALTAEWTGQRGQGLDPVELTCISIFTDGRHAVTGAADGSVWVWNLMTGTPRQFLKKHTTSVNSVWRGNDDTWVFSSGGTRTIVWDWRAGVDVASFTFTGAKPLAIVDTPVVQTALVGLSSGYATIWAWNRKTTTAIPFILKSRKEIEDYWNQQIDAKKWMKNKGALLTEEVHRLRDEFRKQKNAFEHRLGLPNMSNWTWTNRMGNVNCLTTIPLATQFAAGYGDGAVRVWSSITGELKAVMRGHNSSVLSLAAFSTKKRVVSGGDDGTVRVWDVRTGLQLFVFDQSFGGAVRAVAWVAGHPGVFAAGGDDGRVHVYDCNKGYRLQSFDTNAGRMTGLAANPGRVGWLATVHADGVARYWRPL